MGYPIADESPMRSATLTPADVDAILDRQNGPYVLLECVRMGLIDAESAVDAIEKAKKPPLYRRVGYALLNTFFGR